MRDASHEPESSKGKCVAVGAGVGTSDAVGNGDGYRVDVGSGVIVGFWVGALVGVRYDSVRFILINVPLHETLQLPDSGKELYVVMRAK